MAGPLPALIRRCGKRGFMWLRRQHALAAHGGGPAPIHVPAAVWLTETLLVMDRGTIPVPSDHCGPSGPLEGIMDQHTRASHTLRSSAGRQGAATAAQRCSASIGVTSSELPQLRSSGQCYRSTDSGCFPWLNGSRGRKALAHRVGGGALDGSLAPELVSVSLISAPMDQAQPKALAST